MTLKYGELEYYKGEYNNEYSKRKIYSQFKISVVKKHFSSMDYVMINGFVIFLISYYLQLSVLPSFHLIKPYKMHGDSNVII